MSDKKRAPNFSHREKSVLLNIVFDFKHIIENKKSDSVTWKEKDEAWNKISNIFNSQSPQGHIRTKNSLRKYYENIKKDVRKEVAAEKKEIKKTGGGMPDVDPNKDPSTDLILDIINTKTVFGLPNHYDSDMVTTEIATLTSDDALEDISENPIIIDLNDDIGEHSYCNRRRNSAENELSQVSKILATPSRSMENDVTIGTRGPNANVSTQKVNLDSTEKDWGDFSIRKLRQPKSTELKHQWSKRRRPNIQQLSSSQLSEEYMKLAKLKYEVYEAEKDNILLKRQREEEIFQLQKRNLELDIELKEIQIKKLKTSF